MVRAALTALLLAAAIAGAGLGCYAPNYPVGLACAPVTRACPPGQGCNVDGFCAPNRDGGGAPDGPAPEMGPRCGNGTRDPGEECDGTGDAGVTCDPTCHIADLMVHWALGDEYMGNAMIPDLATADGVQNGIINNRSGDGPVFQPVADRHGAANKALEITRNDYLSSTYGYVNCPAVTSLPPAVTLALWVATESSSGDGLLFGIRRGPHLYQDNGAVTAQVPDSPLDVTGVGSVPLTRDRWTFVAGVFTSPAAAGGAWAVSLYVDGALVASGTPANANIATIGELMMGGLFDCITPDSGSDDYICDYGFVGALDNARLYGRALSAGEIETLFQLP